MPAPAENVFLCQQCGAHLPGAEAHCLHCMLSGGLETAAPEREKDSAPSHEAEPLTSTRFYQHYKIQTRADGSLYELGRGAMGITYKALDVNLHLPVALKVTNARFSAQPQARARFLREARAAARLRHPNVASVFHYGALEHGPGAQGAEECFYAMEFVEGETLETRVRRAGPLPTATVLEIALQIARALSAAEKRGLVHRDLKPSNIMLAAEHETAGEAWVKVIDFGLAKAMDTTGEEATGDTFATRGGFHGTPEFASPEQIKSASLDVRSDIYSLGVTLWFALTGELPFAGGSLAEMHDRQLHRPLPASGLQEAGVSPRFIALLRSMLAADPAKRPASASALCEMIAGLAAAKTRRPVFAAAVMAALVIATAVGYFALRASPVGSDGKSVAVLPLENLSEGSENAFFAEGIQDDMLTSLGKIKDLRVISRSSVLQYKAGVARDVRAIGRELGVAHVVQGSVRRMGDRVLVNVQLVNTATQHQVWTERYDRTLYDTLTLQGELATEIATTLHATLDAGEKARVQSKPTSNPEAYVLYLRARSFEIRPTYLLEDFRQAEALYAEALALDPAFALAHARLSATLAYIYRNSTPTEELKRRAHEQADEALRIEPDLGEGHLARALCFYRIERDYESALQELEIAARLLPNDAEVDTTTAFIRRRQGRWADALARLESAQARDPRNAQIAQELFNTHRMMRDWPAAARAGDHAIALAPDLPLLRLERAYLELWSKGDLGSLQAALAHVPPAVDPDGVITWMRWDVNMIARDFAAAERVASNYQSDTLPSVAGAPLPKSYLQGLALLAAGEPERARGFFETARRAMETEIEKNPGSAIRHARLGMLYAYTGHKEEAIRAGRRATELQPEATDAYGGAFYSSMLALIYTQVGEPAQALALIERLLTIPGAVFHQEAGMTLPELKMRWQWDPLRAEPRFQKIVNGPEPVTRP